MGLFSKGNAPKSPDMSALADASVETAKIWERFSQDQLLWSQEQYTMNRDLLQQVLNVQLPQMAQAALAAEKDRARYEDVFQGVEDNLVRDFETYDTPQRQEQYAAQRMADVSAAFEAQRENALQRLDGYGVRPDETRSMALDRGVRAIGAAQQALAGNQGRQYVENMGRALRGEAINIGRGMPAQVAQSQGIVNQTGNSALANASNTINTGVNAMNPAFQAGGMAQQGYGQAANITNAGYQNQLNRWQANAGASNALWGGIGELAGSAMGMYGMTQMGGAEGGKVPDDLSPVPMPGDKHSVMLADNEYVVPASVVLRKGTEFFDKLVAKVEEEEAAKRQGIPVGGEGKA